MATDSSNIRWTRKQIHEDIPDRLGHVILIYFFLFNIRASCTIRMSDIFMQLTNWIQQFSHITQTHSHSHKLCNNDDCL